jgi:hypothetical protein
MNNSDIIAALSLALIAIIFLFQTDDGLLKLKFSYWEKRIILIGIILIILLCNHEIFDRFNTTFYFTIRKIFLTPNEWALILFLGLITFLLLRVFSNKIFNNDVKTIFYIIQKYRAEKKVLKLQNVLQQVIELKNFEKDYAERLNDTIFNDHYLIEHYASNCPELLISFTERFNGASIYRGEHFYYILNGLFVDKSNPIFSEIRQYKNEEIKHLFVYPYWTQTEIEDFQFDLNKNYQTKYVIINWLTDILRDFPTNLQRDSLYFLNQFKESAIINNNERIYSENEIEAALSRDPLYNSIQLFRILLIEISLNDKRILIGIDRVLTILYSSWDFVESCTQLKSGEVQLDNDSYTINEYLLQYLFDSYCSLVILNKKILATRVNQNPQIEEHTGFIIKQLYSKVDSIIASNVISGDSKKYFITRLLDLYFNMPDYLSGDTLEKFDKGQLHYFKLSLDNSPWGNSNIYKIFFRKCCDYGGYDFWSETDLQKKRAAQFYTTLLPYTQELEYRICQGR